jgi:Fic family protein
MMTLGRLCQSARDGHLQIPASTAWTLEEIGVSRGRQELYTRQSPQILKRLRENAIVESAVSSNRIEGVEVEPARVGTVVFGHRTLGDRDEEEVRGYRNALKMIHERPVRLDVSEKVIRQLHSTCRNGQGDAGRYKERDGDIIERLPGGGSRVRLPAATPIIEVGVVPLVDQLAHRRRCVFCRYGSEPPSVTCDRNSGSPTCNEPVQA